MNVLIDLEEQINDVEYYTVTIIFEKDDFGFTCELSCEENFSTIHKWYDLLNKFEPGQDEAKRRVKFTETLFLDIQENTSGLTLYTEDSSIVVKIKNEAFINCVINRIINFLHSRPKARLY